MSVTVEMGETEYRLIGPGGEEGMVTDYGFPAMVKSGADFFYAHVTDPDTQTAEVFRVASVDPVENKLEDVSFMADGEDEEDVEDEEEEPGTGPVITVDPEEEEGDEDDEEDPDTDGDLDPEEQRAGRTHD